MMVDRLLEFLQRLTPLSRSCLLSELERQELCEIDVPGSSDILAKLRAEFRKDGSTQSRASSPSRHFFAPLEILPDRWRARAPQSRADLAQFAGPDLGVDLPRRATDDGARL